MSQTVPRSLPARIRIPQLIGLAVAVTVMLVLVFSTLSDTPPKNNPIDKNTTLTKRNRWTFSRIGGLAGLVIAAAATIGAAWAPILCATPAAPACFALASGVTAATAVSTVVAGSAAFTDKIKRDLGFVDGSVASAIVARYQSQYMLENTTQHTYPVVDSAYQLNQLYKPDSVYDQVVDIFASAGLGVPLLTTNVVSGLRKRSKANATIAVHWFTSLGFHTASHLPHYDVVSMAQDIAEQYKSGYNGTDQYQRLGTNLVSKRQQRYEVDWVSYNVDNENSNLEKEVWDLSEDPGDWEVDIANTLYTNDLQNTWKWCLTVMASGNSDYNSFGEADATHGEAYTNQYGGIDNYCNDNKGGAQCETDRCQ
ncbi:some similarities with Saccharomyces cerevisiae YGL262W Putative protein of unknown function [Maudiozyma barnettii]|uniref:Uncharacterized protein n=1 Tax=Maudiozyma barnettii TaxID=61262 RepID=A0A8H2ZHH3_9SACH|nr:uncharacterized protein KABA2_05S00528 [Kazachstania barnettii]CAB4254768.1 some similarities with Saccharomyces cerevisiae YGL262W Putative protein of unknown function [Kazachstania barnettii]CAD1782899.1 some similarities with Saccharomyces cerevisiae YGL262W Putative protein of unknown function [Kazachstania barnettii]